MEVHPRVSGVLLLKVILLLLVLGSSPRERGFDQQCLHRLMCGRFIPA